MYAYFGYLFQFHKGTIKTPQFVYSYLHYCPVKILDLEINRVDHHPLGR